MPDFADSSDDEFFDCQEEVKVKYYAISYPKERGSGEVLTDIQLATKRLKEVKGSRLKVFHDHRDANRFARTHSENLYSPQIKEVKTRLKKNVDPFPNVTQRDLNCLRVSIEKGDYELVKNLIWNNPRHLVTECDAPTILQVRFRYNALHSAAGKGHANIIIYILDLLNDINFWRSLYPGTEHHVNQTRKEHITDLFLNSPETGNMETPLHFASKFGHIDCIRALISHPVTEKLPTNREGLTPFDVACTRYAARSADFSAREVELRTVEVRRALDERYIILVKTESEIDLSAKILTPVDLCQLTHLIRSSLKMPKTAPFIYSKVKPCVTEETVQLRAFAGPMTADEAVIFYQEWNVPPRIKRDIFAEMKLTDQEKGFERLGRHLASKYSVQWKEYWDFLDDFVDLSSEEGLKCLEHHLCKNTLKTGEDTSAVSSSDEEYSDSLENIPDNTEPKLSVNRFWKYRDPTPTTSKLLRFEDEDSGESSDPRLTNDSSLESNNASFNNSGGMMNALAQMFAKLSLISPIRWSRQSPARSDVSSTSSHERNSTCSFTNSVGLNGLSSPCDLPNNSFVHHSTPIAASKSSRLSFATPRSSRIPKSAKVRRSIGNSGYLTKSDIDALRALRSNPNKNIDQYPHVRLWRDEIHKYDVDIPQTFSHSDLSCFSSNTSLPVSLEQSIIRNKVWHQKSASIKRKLFTEET